MKFIRKGNLKASEIRLGLNGCCQAVAFKIAPAADGKKEKKYYLLKNYCFFLLGGYFFVGQHNNAIKVQIKKMMHIACPCAEYC